MNNPLRGNHVSDTTLTAVTAAVRGKHSAWISCLATFWVISLLTSLVITIYGIYARFVPANHFVDLFTIPSVIIAILLVIPMLLFHFKGRSPLRGTFKGTLGMLVTVVVLPVALSQGLLIGVPSLAHHFVPSDEMTQSHTVSRKSPTYHRVRRLKACNGRLYLESDRLLLGPQVCGLGRNEWNRASPGDRIYLEGDVSWFGMKYSQARLPAANSSTD